MREEGPGACMGVEGRGTSTREGGAGVGVAYGWRRQGAMHAEMELQKSATRGLLDEQAESGMQTEELRCRRAGYERVSREC